MNAIQQDTYNDQQSWCQKTLVRATGSQGQQVTLEINVRRNAYDFQCEAYVNALDGIKWTHLLTMPFDEWPVETRAVNYVCTKAQALHGMNCGTEALYRRAEALLCLASSTKASSAGAR